MDRTKKIHLRKSHGFKIIIFCIIIFTCVQVWFLYSNYKEIVTKLPKELFASPGPFPVSELVVHSHYRSPEEVASAQSDAGETGESSGNASLEESVETLEALKDEASTDEEMENSSTENTGAADTGNTAANEFELSETQKNIVLRLMELLEEDIQYGYQIYPDSGYPADNIWISTDVISMVLKDTGYDLMELIYNDMIEHKEDYPLDEIKNRKDPIKYIDFRDVFFQEKFFKRNALELDLKFISGDKDNNIQWQPGDIVYFQFDPDNPYQDLGGFISSRKNASGVPLVIMISKEFGKVSEVDKLLEYTIVGHYRYPNPYEETASPEETENIDNSETTEEQ